MSPPRLRSVASAVPFALLARLPSLARVCPPCCSVTAHLPTAHANLASDSRDVAPLPTRAGLNLISAPRVCTYSAGRPHCVRLTQVNYRPDERSGGLHIHDERREKVPF
ncbi:hypothetical protein MSAN_01981300 [Mycena sanguinolenta]|uniref:Secreted protein n=1 Tax=Mycena sanguinolenta TaxID=230812 RepID=A0A8H6XL14_9AGAR|nr:hypothetical protein MSAN_01981300 [Mycena sanguinolenta]